MGKNHHNLAILVGINAYENGIPSLKTPVNDVAGLAEVLKSSYQYDVKQLLDSEATLEGLNRLLENLKEGILTLSDNRIVKIESYNRFLFYFAGHGIVDDAFENQDSPAGYLIPQDAQKSDKSTFLAMQQLHDVLVELKCRHLLVILDCCFAGAFRFLRNLVPPQKLYRERYDRFMKGKAQQMIASAAYDEKALDVLTRSRLGQREDKNTGKHSPFAEVLLKALQIETDEAKAPADIIPDGVITASELYIYLEKELAEVTDRQTPGLYLLKHHEKGEYIFQVPGFVPNNLEKAPPLDESTNPYRGLKPYEAENSELFFGREQVIRDLVNHVSDATKPPLTVVLGVSGSGKSSLVKAGLIPRLLKEEKEYWQILEPIRPPALVKALATDNQPQISNNWQLTPQILLEKLKAKQNHSGKKLLLVIDQFEELVTQSSQEDKRKLLDALKQLLTHHSNEIQVVITLRSEFESQFASEFVNSGKEVVLFAIIFLAIEKLYKFIPILSKSYQNLAQKRWMAARFVVPTMTQDEFREVIEKPAVEKVLYFEPPKLVDKLINEVLGMPGALPLLSFTLSELYLKYLERRSDNRAMTQEDYEALGGVMGSLKTSATRVYNQLVQKDSSYKQTIRHVMLRMVAVGGGELARRAVPKSELKYPYSEENERVNTVIDCFLKARLLVSGTDAQGKVYYEPAHDALILGWDTLLEWRQNKKEQENLLLQRQLTPAVEDWKEIEQSRNKVEPIINIVDQGLDLIDNSWKFIKTQFTRLWRSNSHDKNPKKSKFLWDSNPRLNLLQEVLNSSDNWLSETEAEFVQSSIKQSRRNIALLVSGIITFIVGLIIFSVIALIGQRDALIGQVRSSQRSAETLFSAGDKQLEPLIEALKAGKILHREILLQGGLKPSTELQTQVRGTLWKVLYQTLEQTRLLHQDKFYRYQVSPNGKFILTASTDNTVKVWNLKGEEISTLPHQGEFHFSAKFSPDSNLILTTSNDNTVKVWNLKGEEISTLPHQGEFYSAKFSPNSNFILTASTDNTLKVWNLNGDEFATLSHHEKIGIRQFSPDSNLIVTTSDDKTATVWSLRGEKLTTLPHQDNVYVVQFSPNGKFILTQSRDTHNAVTPNTVKLWNLEGQELAEIPRFSFFTTTQFSPDSNSILIETSNHLTGHATLWNLEDKDISASLPAYNRPYWAELSPDGNFILITSVDNGSELFNLEGKKLATLPHKDANSYAKFSPDSKFILTTSADKTAKVWNLEGKKLATLPHDNDVSHAEFSPDSNFILTAPVDNTIKVWNLKGEELAILPHQDAVVFATFNPNDNSIITASTDNTVKVWNNTAKPWNIKGEEFVTISHQDKVVWAQFSPDGNSILTTSRDDGIVKLSNLKGEELAILPHQDGVYKPEFSPNGKFILTPSDGKAILWNLKGKKLITLPHYHLPYRAQFSPNGKFILTDSGYDTAKLWSLKGEEMAILDVGNLRTAQFSPNGNFIVTTSGDRTAKVWNLQGEELVTLHHKNYVGDAEFSPDSKLILTNSSDRTAKVWNLQGEELVTLHHKDYVGDAEFSPDGKLILTTSSDRTAKLWNLKGEEIAMLSHQNSTSPYHNLVNRAGFSSDGNLIITTSNDGTQKAWNLKGEALGTLRRQEIDLANCLNCLHELAKLSPDGNFLLTTPGNTAKVWNLKGEELATLTHQGEVHGAEFSPDGSLILTASSDRTAKAWSFPHLSKLLTQACTRVDYYLKYYPDIEDSDRQLCDHIEDSRKPWHWKFSKYFSGN